MHLPLCNCTVVPRSALPHPLVLLLPLADVSLLPLADVLPLTTGSVPVSALRATFRVDSSVSATHSCHKGTSDGRGRGGKEVTGVRSRLQGRADEQLPALFPITPFYPRLPRQEVTSLQSYYPTLITQTVPSPQSNYPRPTRQTMSSLQPCYLSQHYPKLP